MGRCKRMVFATTACVMALGVGRAAAQKVYWIEESAAVIERANADGTGREVIVTGLGAPEGIEVDVVNGKMYWTDANGGKIQRANLDGSGVADFILGLFGPAGIALDLAGGKVYWAEFGRVRRANLADGSFVENLYSSADGLLGPRGVAVDAAGGKVYWADVATGKVQRANLDGSSPAPEDLATGLLLPIDVALDTAAGKVYWAENGGAVIRRANLDGSGVELVVAGLSRPESLALDLDAPVHKVYWTDSGSDKVQRANLDGTGVEDIITTGLPTPQGIAVDPGCGNGVATPGEEECDDGNLIDGDGCDSNCTLTVCGNGIASSGEECDDGNTVDGDGCDTNCTVTRCGNGILTGVEECDDGNLMNVDGCDSTCTREPYFFVDQDATGPTFDGSSWCRAFPTVDQAISALTGAETAIFVAEGTYVPDPTGLGDAREATFALQSGVVLEGGYQGCGFGGPHVSRPADHPTTLSGDLNGDDGPNFLNNGENAYHVVSGVGVDATAVLSGFTIRGGNADGTAPHDRGAGLLNDGGSPTVVRCTFLGNAAAQGGGVYNGPGGAPVFANSRFVGNFADGEGGGAMFNDQSDAVLYNCAFSGNTHSGSTGQSGGLYSTGSTVTVSNCTFNANTSNQNVGGVFTIVGTTAVRNSILWDNVPLQILGATSVRYSCVEGGVGGTGNIASDPLFTDADGADNVAGTEDDDLSLSDGSPCLDSAENASVAADGVDLDGDGDTAEQTPVDLGEQPRFVDDPNSTDCDQAPGTCGTAPIADMGAYEFQVCHDVFECCDLDTDGIRDDGCTWCACTGNCEETPLVIPSDMGGPFGACSPDGFCNVHDANHALSCFAGLNTCDSLNVDAGGSFGTCPPDGFCNIHDANHALSCFSGLNTCVCGPAPVGAQGPRVVGKSGLTVVANRSSVRPGEQVQIRVFVDDGLANLQSYQLHLGVSGGRSGHLELLNITVEPRTDFVFADAGETFSAVNLANGQMLSGLLSQGIATPGKGYLATFTYRASAEAVGSFVIDVLHDEANNDQTFLIASYQDEVAVSRVTPAVVRVGLGESFGLR